MNSLASGQGQVVDAAIVDGVGSMMTMFAGLAPESISLRRGENILAGAAPFYRCYRCADDKYISIGALEPKFYAELIRLIGAPDELVARQNERARWEADTATLTNMFAGRSRDEWSALLEGTDCCFAPVLELDEVLSHQHMLARDAYTVHDGVIHTAPAPRFSRTPGKAGETQPRKDLLAKWGL